LLSGFFIVALLFGVAFAMGYIVGRNSSPAQKADSHGTTVIEQRPTASSGVVATPPVEAPRTDVPPTPAPEPAAQATPASLAEKPVAPPAAEPVPAPAAVPAAAEHGADPPSGSYWQVTAVAQKDAELVQKVLREKSFPARTAPGTKNLTRVIVGPYPDRDSLGKAKVDLENAGFHPILLKK
jgi:cell division septation protein DedD